MTANAVQQAAYSDLKVIKSRGQFQIILEAPLEQMARFVEMFGAPCPGAETPVALARLAPPAEPKPVRNTEAARERGKAAYATADEMTRACTRAALLCRDRQFQTWCMTDNEAGAADHMRNEIGGKRREIGLDSRIFENFLALETTYRQDTGQLPERRG